MTDEHGRNAMCSKAMREAGFRELVQEDGRGEVPDWALRAATEFFVEESRVGRDDVQACIRLARRFTESHKTEAEETTGERGLAVLGRDLAEKIRPRVEKVRRGLFGRSSAPFPSAEKAAEWIRRQGVRRRRMGERDRKRAEDLIVELERLVGREFQIKETNRPLPYLMPGQVRPALLETSGLDRERKAARLEQESRNLAEATGFSQESVVMHILTGTLPSLPTLKLSTTYRRLGEPGAPLKSVIVETFQPNVTSAQLRNLHRRVRAGWGVQRVRQLSPAQADLLELVKRMRAERQPSGESAKGFWGRVTEQWNRSHPEASYKGWRGVEMRYRRLKTTSGPGSGGKDGSKTW